MMVYVLNIAHCTEIHCTMQIASDSAAITAAVYR
jgi:hypothetical protein